MATEIIMPELGESVHEITVSRWLKKIGDPVKEDEPIVEIMTDKVNTELQAPTSGVLVKILVPEGQNARVFQPLGLIGEPSEIEGETPQPTTAQPTKVAEEKPAAKADVEEKPAARIEIPPAKEEVKVTVETAPPPSEDGKRWYSPVVRAMAKQHQISDAELATIRGTGSGGRVTRKDLEQYIATREKARPPVEAPPPAAPTVPQPVQPTPKPTPGVEQEVITLIGLRKAIADAMTKAHTIPSVSTVTSVDVSKLVEFRKANKESFQQMYGVRLTYTPFFIKAATETLLEFPMLNSYYSDEGKLVMNHSVHMGVAVALGGGDEGLIVPVIRDCHKKNLVEIAKDLEEISAKARENKLALADVQGATFSLTNPGSYGALFGTPMIPPYQGGILGTYAIHETPVAIDGMITVRPMMYLVLTYDHRIIDGMLAGRFLQAIKKRLEEFAFFR
ncbi:MAG TPA: dihydrolipoamide acetyltransferase family protein [Fimbriimonadales bacterium]|nr:dihydrolipoamide acetyltransferase family protein [Fimbriimonadales bacterium]